MAIDVLRTFHVVNGKKTCRDMRDTNGGFCLVTFLSTGACAAHRVAAAFGEKLLFGQGKKPCPIRAALNGSMVAHCCN